MRHRPSFVILMATILAGVGLSLPLQVMWIYGHKLDELDLVFAKLTFLNWGVMIGAFTCAFMTLQASPRLRVALPVLTGLVAVNNFFVGVYAIDYSAWAATMGTLAFTGLNLPLLRGPLRDLLRNPDRRWWRHASRHRMAVPIFLGQGHGTPLRAETFDLSESGVFIAIEGDPLRVDDLLSVRLNFGTFAQVRCEARVVRRSSARGEYPSGYGLQFLNLDARQKQELRRHITSH